jgi:hypothetical protein
MAVIRGVGCTESYIHEEKQNPLSEIGEEAGVRFRPYTLAPEATGSEATTRSKMKSPPA